MRHSTSVMFSDLYSIHIVGVKERTISDFQSTWEDFRSLVLASFEFML